ncbi:DUF2290 domain-containing protein [Mycobacteroides chelonae]|uniref:DUF2290 domain-containing protein n=1 Tax=Mycobacteroides chelonae TaxID=1774 RepID=UPI0009934393
MYSQKQHSPAARLALLPSPDLTEYQNDPELWTRRFDFDPTNHVEIHHASSHLTLGMCKNCRFAATARPTLGQFIDSILRSFYNTALRSIRTVCLSESTDSAPALLSLRQQLIHIGLPPNQVYECK